MIAKDKMQAIRAYFSNQPEVVAVYLYGSFARGTNNALSDIDIAVMVEKFDETTSKRHIEFIGAMMDIFKTDDVDVQILTMDSPPAIALAMIKGQVVYCRSVALKAAIEAVILSRYQDFAPFINYQISEMEKRLKAGTYANRYR